MKRKVLCLLLAVAMLIGLIPIAAVAEGGTITLRMSWWGGETVNQRYYAAFEAYEASHPGIVIEGEPQDMDGYLERMMSGFVSGTAWDIITVDAPTYPQILAQGDFFVDLNDYPELFDSTTFNQDFLKNFCEYDGKLQGFPISAGACMLVVNATAAGKYGVDLSEEFTWDMIYDAGVKLNAEYPEAYIMTLNADELNMMVRQSLKCYVDQLFDQETYEINFTVEQLTTTLEFVKKCYDDGVFEPLDEAASQTMDGNIINTKLWMESRDIMQLCWSGGMEYLRYFIEDDDVNVQIMQFPIVAGYEENGSCEIRPDKCMSINKNSEHIEEAIEFCNWFINSTEAVDYLQGDSLGGAFVTTATIEYAAENGISSDLWSQAYEEALGRQLPRTNDISNNTELIDVILRSAGERVFYGQQPADVAAAVYQELLNKLAELKMDR